MMADFSEFGGVAAEWEALHLAPERPSDLSVEELRSSTNREREEGARQYLHSIGTSSFQSAKISRTLIKIKKT